ncbi:MAG: metallophosphoesterase [Bdellovibrionales bacterium]|nr:metallophosphoesterase [Bdellovibrionales bacterium]
MKIAAISDVHVKQPHDDADHLLCHFLTNPIVTSCDYILLLGDIFDLMCGPHKAYLEKFGHIFDLLDLLQKKGKKVLFFEGNHDVHLEKLFKLRWPNEELKISQIPMVENIDGKTYYFSHGDEHEVENISYQRYKSLILSSPLKFVANYVMPYSVLNYLGNRASKMSRKRGSKSYNEELIKQNFRNGVAKTTAGKYNFILGGHSHVRDVFSVSETSTYVNNGYALKSRTFVLIDNHQISFPELT